MSTESGNFFDQQMERRRLLQGGLIGAGGLAAGSLLPNLLLPTPAGAAAAVGKPKGNLRIALPTFNEGTWLTDTGSGSRSYYSSAIYEYPYMAGLKQVGLAEGLLTSLNVSANGLTLTGNVRKGVRFHDGTLLTSRDIAYTYSLMIDSASSVSTIAAMKAGVKSVDASNPGQIVFHFNEPYVGFASLLSYYTFFCTVVSESYIKRVGHAVADKKPIGTGPFKFKSQSLDTIELTAVNPHWRVVPQYETLTFQNVPEPSTAVDLLKTGGTDLISPDVQSAGGLLNDDGYKVFSSPGGYTLMLLFGNNYIPSDKNYTTAQPYNNPLVRQALNIAIDRDAIIKDIYKGYAKPARLGIFDSVLPASVPAYPYNPTMAKALLAQAGYPNGFPIILNSWPFSPGAELPSIIEIVAEYWAAIGVQPQIVTGEFATFASKWFGGQIPGQVFGITYPGVLSGKEAIAAQWYASNGVLRIYENAALDTFISQWATETSPAAQSSSAISFAKQLYNDYSEIAISSVDSLFIGRRSEIKSYSPPSHWAEGYYEYTVKNPSDKTKVLYTPEPTAAWSAISNE
jgi:peptide/nickel transport system substrate-binding protein